MSTSTPQYTQLDSVTYLNMIRQRIRDLEVQFAQLNLRINAPAPTDVITEQDRQNLSQLQTSLDYLKGIESQVQQQIDNPPPLAMAGSTPPTSTSPTGTTPASA